MAWWEYYRYPRSTPRQAKGGIKAQSKRGAFGQSWWAKRWIAVLESFQIGARLGRGRSYARSGQVTSIDIQTGLVKARVQGSRARPYDVTIEVKVLPPSGWKALAQVMAEKAIFAAKLLAGEMPQDIEDAFRQARLSLFPERLRDLRTRCSCPDWSNPCKHIAAVYYLIGEEFDRDPFLILKLRGMDRDEMVQLLGSAGGDAKAGCTPSPGKAPRSPRRLRRSAGEPPASPEDARPSTVPVAANAQAFWDGGRLPDDVFGEVRVPPVPATLARRLGSFPFWRAEERFLEAIEPVYREASSRGMETFLGDVHPD